MKRFMLVAALLLPLMTIASTAQAAFSFSWNGPDGAPAVGSFLEIKLTNFEVLLKQWEGSASETAGNTRYSAADIASRRIAGGVPVDAGEEFYGILRFSTIQNSATGDIHWQASTTQEMTAVFGGFILKSVSGFNAVWEEGFVDVYGTNTPNYNTALGPFSGAPTEAWGVDVTLLDNTTAHSGVSTYNGVGDAMDQLIWQLAAVQGTTDTAEETLATTFTQLGAGGVIGSGTSFLTQVSTALFIAGNDALNHLANPLTSAGNQDLRLISDFSSSGPQGIWEDVNGWTLQSQDPVIFRFDGIVPEPGSMLVWLTLAGLAGVGAVTRRRRQSEE